MQKGISFAQGMAVGTLENVKDMWKPVVNFLLLPYNISQNQDVRFGDTRDLIEGLANGTYNQTAFYEGMVTADVGCMISGFGLAFVFGGTTTALDTLYPISVPFSGGATGVAAPVVAEVSVAGIAATALSIEFGVVSGVNLLEDLGRVTESRGKGSLGDKGGSKTVVNSNDVPYPEVVDIRTGQNMVFPDDVGSRIPKDSRVGWYRNQDEANLYRVNDTDILCKKDYIDEWYRKGYSTPKGVWDLYEIHHIKPREFGGSADFENMVPVLKDVHRKVITPWWNAYGQ